MWIAAKQLQTGATEASLERVITLAESMSTGEIAEIRNRLTNYLKIAGYRAERDGHEVLTISWEGVNTIVATTSMSDSSPFSLRTCHWNFIGWCGQMEFEHIADGNFYPSNEVNLDESEIPSHDAYRLLWYFERVSVQWSRKLLDRDLAVKMLARHAVWWDSALQPVSTSTDEVRKELHRFARCAFQYSDSDAQQSIKEDIRKDFCSPMRPCYLSHEVDCALCRWPPK